MNPNPFRIFGAIALMSAFGALTEATALAQSAGASSNSKASSAAATKSAAKTPSRFNAGAQAVVARVNNKPIYRGEVDQAVQTLARGQELTGENLRTVQAQVLQQLVNRQLLLELLAREKITPTESQIEEHVQKERKRLQSAKESLEDKLRAAGTLMSDYKKQIAASLSISMYLERQASDEVLEGYFKKNARQFDGTELRVSHILIRPTGGSQTELGNLRRQAADIKAEIDSGKISFADAAKKYSSGPSRHHGGDLGFIARRGPMIEEFNRPAFELEPNQVSEPVVTPFGVHLISVTEVKAGEKTFADARNDVVQTFMPVLFETVLKREMEQAKVEFSDSFPHFEPGSKEVTGAK
jgi:parvulin-like peptidyl-prolyl isomerase